MRRSWKTKFLAAAAGFLATAVCMLPAARAVSMSDYTWYPLFMQQTVPPNILFIVDFSDAMLPAAYGNYPISYSGNTNYSSNHAGAGLEITDSETFNSSTTYFGMFEPLGCYSEGTNDFNTRTAKATISTACASGKWDGNFLNWLAARKIDAAKKVLIGGRTLSASNNDGTANTLLGEPKTGQNGSTNTCNNSSDACYRYVKFVRSSALAGRFNTTAYSAADTAWQASGTVQGTGSVDVQADGITVLPTAGAASPTNFSTTDVTIAGGTFLVGDTITIAGQSRTITAIASDSALTVATAFSPAITNSTYSGTRTSNPGTVAVAAGSATVTGTGTSFGTTVVVGNVIKVGTQIRRVTAVGSATSLTVEPAFTSAVAAGTGYDVYTLAAGVAVGTVTTGSGPNADKVSGSGTDFKAASTYPVAVNDVMQIGSGASAQFRVISTVTNDTSVAASASWSPQVTAATSYLVYQPASSTTLTGPGAVDATGTAVTATVSAPAATQLTTLFTVGQTIQIGTGGGAQTGTVASVGASEAAGLTVAAPGLTPATSQSYFNVSASLQGPGTVTTTGATTVTGSGTTFTSRFVAGEKIRIAGVDYTIASITSDTVLDTTVVVPAASGATYNGPDGVYFGSGEGKIYVNGDGDADPFDAAASRQFTIRVDLTAETDAFRQAQSWGLLQNLRTDNMRVAVMFTNSDNGKAATLFRPFDGIFNASAITGIRNQPLSSLAALAEATYEGLCYYRNSQGACYNNNPNDFTASVGAAGDPFYFLASAQTVSCCKSFILMISSGIPTGDGGTPDSQTPFGNLLNTAVSNVGLTTTQLDDVAYYGQTHDIRNQGTGITGDVPNTQAVTFYAVNAMGGASGAAVLSSAAKFGGFTDQDGDNLPTATGQTCTFPAGSNLGSGTSTSSAEWDEDKDCTPDTFFDASQGGDLESQINKAIASILKKAASGTSVSVLATSSTGEGAIYQAYFLPETAKDDGTTNTVKWQGFTQGLFIDTFGNIREDTDGDGRLTLKNDNIITLSFNTGTSTVSVLRCPDADGNGKADSTAVPPCSTVLLSDIKPIWEAGKRLAYTDPGTNCTVALAGTSCRRILAWADNNDHLVASSEVIEFTVANKATLCPYLAAATVAYCTSTDSTLIDAAAISGDAALTNCSGLTRATCALNDAANLINFHRGADGTTLCTVTGDPSTCLRDRSSKVLNPDNLSDTTGLQKVWKLGDVVDATPTVVGSPRERYDVIYGDSTYTTFFNQYKNRRQVAYVGANDGMLHAFNVGFFTQGDDPCTTTGTDPVEHGYFTLQPFANIPHTASQCAFATTARTGNPKFGAELWAFVPQALLPHLKWYADKNYTHVAYVDLKPKVTDVRIFCGDSTAAPDGSPSTCINGQTGSGTHPGGWGTILIGGMRFGGSCGACVAGSTGGVPMTVTADFGSGSQTRTFYAEYFVLDITDPEQDPVLLWTFTETRMGLTMSFPAVARVSLVGDSKASPTNARWLAIFGTGATGYTGISTQTAGLFVVDIAKGPKYSANQASGSIGGISCSAATPCVVSNTTDAGEQVRVFSTGDANSFMGDIITLDANLDFKVDVLYAGSIITNSTPAYIGKMYRLTTGALNTTSGTPATVSSWGITSSGAQVPTTLVATFTAHGSATCAGSTCKVGPVTAAATVSADTVNNIWVFFGSGRFLSTADKTDTATQYFFGVKDPCATSSSCTQTTTSQSNKLLDVSNAVVCNPCASGTNEVTGVADATSLSQLEGRIQDPVQNIDGWFTTLPTAGERSLSAPTILGGTVFFTTFIPTTDICVAAGSGNLYALYYLTGSAYKESVIGTTTASGTTTIKRSTTLGTGLPSQMAVQIGAEGTGASGSSGSGSGCAGRVTGFIQASTGVLGSVCGKPALSVWSRMLSWRDL